MPIFDAVSPLERIQLSGALAAKIAALAAQVPPLQRIRLARETGEIIAQLTRSVVRVLAVNLADREASATALSQYLESGLSDIAPALQPLEAMTVTALADLAGAKEVSGRSMAIVRAAASNNAAMRAAAFQEIAARGVQVDLKPEAVKERLDAASAMLRAQASEDEEFSRLNQALTSLNNSIEQDLREIDPQLAAMRAKRGTPEFDQSEYDELQLRRYDLVDRFHRDFEEVRAKAQARATAFRAEQVQKSIDSLAAEGGAILSAVLQASPVTEQQAKDWAAGQVLDKSAVDRLARNGYPKDKLLADLAEFYRLTGGKASKVRITSTGARRAFASGIAATTGDKVISVDSNFTKTVLFHELAHHLENDPIAQAAAQGFLAKRREGSQVHRLRDLTGKQGYGKSEVAWKDDFLDPYIGKVYTDGATEVFSMGVQYLANPRDAAMLFARDPEMFALITGYLTSELTPAMQAKLNLHAGAIEEKAKTKESEEATIAAAIELLAREVPITPGSWWNELRQRDEYTAGYLLRGVRAKPGTEKYLGAFGSYHVFEAVARNRKTKRQARGHIVAYDTGGIPDTVAIHEGLDAAKALIALSVRENRPIDSIWYAYFNAVSPDRARKALAEYASQQLEASA